MIFAHTRTPSRQNPQNSQQHKQAKPHNHKPHDKSKKKLKYKNNKQHANTQHTIKSNRKSNLITLNGSYSTALL
jgi:hypothetical protein